MGACEHEAEEKRKKIVADTVDKCIAILKEYPTVTAMGKMEQLKEQNK